MFAIEAATVTAWAASFTVLLYLALAKYAAGQVGEARALREAQSRPFVVAEFDPDFLITFRIRNIGNTIARNVRISWDQWPLVSKSFADDPAWKSPDGSVLFSSGIPNLAPSQEISTLFDHFPNRLSSGLPMTYVVRLTYDGPTSGRKHPTQYTDEFVLDLNLFMGLRHVGVKDLNDLVQETEKIRKTIEKWTDSSQGVKVISTDRATYSARQMRPMHVSSARKAQKEEGMKGLGAYLWTEVRRKYALHGWGEL